ncbi:MAG: hypothetical protein QNK37_39195, partial [Acidobacteriota bacterium]|nr:hypothetical protein [Acidobacteriota bacterium]
MKMILALIWLALTVACTGAEVKEQPADELILRTYQVPSGMAESVKNIMNNNFHLRTDNDNIKQYAKVSVLPNGQLAVLASHNIHNGFSKLVKDLTAENLPQPENLTLELWAVAGIMDGEPDDANIPSALAPALDSLRNQGAAKRFLLLEKLQLTGALGNSSTTQGAVISIRKAELNKANNR